MPFCNNCGHGVHTNDTVCPSCGERIYNWRATEEENVNEQYYYPNTGNVSDTYRIDATAYRQNLIDTFYLRMKWERKAWTIQGIYMFVVAGLYLMLSLLYLFVSILSGDSGDFSMMFILTVEYFVFALMFVALGFISFVLRSKLTKYMDGLYYDCGPAVTRGTSVGMIVFCALFNNVALIFYLINFVYAKENRVYFDEIRQLQYQNNRTGYDY